ncbi:hypothetical protein [Microtetraspora fusca]|uniref:hypothetical protein n=1 Tax=Microtetraspora fusca TaxID=1997 RepID=UPI001FDEDE22|nr:hypothetical protein [Microtetraspora fusca]
MSPAGLLRPPSHRRVAGSRDAGIPAGPDRQGLQAGLGAKDIEALVGLLDPDATGIADGGGLVSAVLRPIEGAEQIARVLVDIADKAPGMGTLEILERTVNGQPGLVARQDGVTVVVMAFDIAGDRIKRFWAVRNPEKLRPWTTR